MGFIYSFKLHGVLMVLFSVADDVSWYIKILVNLTCPTLFRYLSPSAFYDPFQFFLNKLIIDNHNEAYYLHRCHLKTVCPKEGLYQVISPLYTNLYCAMRGLPWILQMFWLFKLGGREMSPQPLKGSQSAAQIPPFSLSVKSRSPASLRMYSRMGCQPKTLLASPWMRLSS